MNKVSLADKYQATEGGVFISGTQALTRILLDQSRRDRAAGLNTAGFISGYRGSPLGGLDHSLWQAKDILKAHDIVFTPGVNEELAATAVYGTQHLSAFGAARVDGVFAAWYGKGPGVDRAGDALKHANLAGTSAHGGVLVFAGDDHQAKSSTTAHQSEQALAAAFVPVLYPANVEEFLSFGALGYALSRYSGLWVGFKCVNETADATMTARLPGLLPHFVTPEGVVLPPGGLNHVPGDSQISMERRTVEFRLPAAQAFAEANGVDRVVLAAQHRHLAIVTAGKAYLDVREALRLLGLDDAAARALGVSVLKLGLVWPASSNTLAQFARGAREVLVIEEKRALIEPQVKEALYHVEKSLRPDVSGKKTPRGEPLLPSSGELTPAEVAIAIVSRLRALGLATQSVEARARALAEQITPSAAPTQLARMPYFCSGCPHNTSTNLPDGAIGLSGIGCHVMAAFMPHRKHVWPVQMGGEGANWVGAAPFSQTPHVFQNLGDGTFYHSGLLAIRSTVAAKTNITYKILFNDAVAMTGGQPVEGNLSAVQMAHVLRHEGATKVVIVADEPERYDAIRGQLVEVEVRPRQDLPRTQQEMAALSGTTVIIYDQACAAEKRRKRKRGQYPDPDRRTFINEAVCEGCGDCSAASNCVSVQPIETEFGRKRRIDQSSCNKDFSCIDGFCPSFVTVEGGRLRAPASKMSSIVMPDLPPVPAVGAAETCSIMITGIGGTGVITIGAILGMAAHLEGKAASVMDMTGLSQKNGAVFSHVRIAPNAEALGAARIIPGGAQVLLACDILAAAAPDVRGVLSPMTLGVINSAFTPTAAITFAPDFDFEHAKTAHTLASAVSADSLFMDCGGIATRLLGDAIFANMFMLGAAAQRGALPVSVASLEEAIALNAVSVAANLQAFKLGRWAGADPGAVEALSHPLKPVVELETSDLIKRRAAFLSAYQDERYAEAFRAFVDKVAQVETRVAPGGSALTAAVARGLSKLMAYKDEYEVARLFGSDFATQLDRAFEPGYRLRFHMAPPLIARAKKGRRPKKMTFGPWMAPALRGLARLKTLRGTAFDPFGWTAERRMERALIDWYRALIERVGKELRSDNLGLAVEIASLPNLARGYGHVKHANVDKMHAREKELLEKWSKQPERSDPVVSAA